MIFLNKETHQVILKNKPKFLDNCSWTIVNSKYLWNMLQSFGVSSLNLKHLNQDIIENFFGQIRSVGHRNINPTPYQFEASFKILLTSNLTSPHSVSSNCQESGGKSMALLKLFTIASQSDVQENDIVDVIDCSEATIPVSAINNMFIDSQNIITLMEKQKCVVDCEQCLNIIKHECILESVKCALNLAELRFAPLCHEIKVKEKLKNILMEEIFSKCTLHCSIVRNLIADITATNFILHWCTFINDILYGKRQEIDDNFMYKMAKKMHLKQSTKKNAPH